MTIATTLNPTAAATATLNREIHVIPTSYYCCLREPRAAASPCDRDNVRFGGWFLPPGPEPKWL
jgi:hypothetical protein